MEQPDAAARIAEQDEILDELAVAIAGIDQNIGAKPARVEI